MVVVTFLISSIFMDMCHIQARLSEVGYIMMRTLLDGSAWGYDFRKDLIFSVK